VELRRLLVCLRVRSDRVAGLLFERDRDAEDGLCLTPVDFAVLFRAELVLDGCRLELGTYNPFSF